MLLWQDSGKSLGQEPAAMAPAAKATAVIDLCIMMVV